MGDNINVARLWRWGVLGFVGLTGAIALIMWLTTASSGVRGKAGVIQKNNDSTNQISAQAEFNRLWGDIQRDATNISLAEDDVHKRLAQKVCAADVATYNGEAQDTTLREWRPSNLPESVDVNQECGINK